MALESFISRADLGDYLRRDLSADDLATIAVNAACAVVRTHTRQALSLVEDETVSFYLAGTARALLLPELPATVHEVRIDDEVTLDYRVEENGIITLTDLPYSSDEPTVEVDYSHGYDPIPDDLRLVALTVAARIYEQGTARQESTGSSSITFSVAASTDLSSGEKAIVEKYRVIRPSTLGITAAGSPGSSAELRSVRLVTADTTLTADDDIVEVDASAYVPEVPPTDEIQLVFETLGDTPSGTYTVTIGGETSGPISPNAPNEDLRTAYAVMPSVELDVNLEVDGGGSHSLIFMGPWGAQDQPLATVDDSGLVDVSVEISVTQEGTAGTPASGDSEVRVTIPADADEAIPVGFECEVWSVAYDGAAFGYLTTAEGVLIRNAYGEDGSLDWQIELTRYAKLRKVETDLWALVYVDTVYGSD